MTPEQQAYYIEMGRELARTEFEKNAGLGALGKGLWQAGKTLFRAGAVRAGAKNSLQRGVAGRMARGAVGAAKDTIAANPLSAAGAAAGVAGVGGFAAGRLSKRRTTINNYG
jgi:hypothetical protein